MHLPRVDVTTREGTYIRESKDGPRATERLIEAVNELLAYDARPLMPLQCRACRFRRPPYQ